MKGSVSKERFWWRVLIASGLGVLVPPMVGLLGTVLGMTRAFDRLGNDGRTSELAGDISFALQTTMVGIVVAVGSAVVFLVALVRYLKLVKVRKENQSPSNGGWIGGSDE